MDGPAAAPRRGRPPKAEARDTRSRILDAALDLFARQGYAGTSVRQIARAVGLSDAGLYAHFAGKRAVYDALLAEWGPSAVPALLDAMEGTFVGSPADFLRAFVGRLVAVWERPRVRRVMDLFIREGGYASEIGRTDVAAARREGLRRAGALVARWQEAGLVADRTPPEWLAWELISPVAYIRILFFHGAATEADLAEGRRLAGEHVEFFIAHLFREPDDPVPSRGPGPDADIGPRVPPA